MASTTRKKSARKSQSTRSTDTKRTESVAPEFVVRGTVRGADGAPMAGARVKAFDQDIARENILGEAVTDDVGNYLITYTAAQFRRTAREIGGPDLVVRVYDAAGQVLALSKRKRNAGKAETVNVVVGEQSPVPGDGKYVVRGVVRGSDGKPAGGMRVRAYDRELRTEELLGEDKTDSDGNYRIAYSPKQFRNAEKSNADLRVCVLDAKGKELISSDVLFNAPAEAVVDLALPSKELRQSEFERHLRAVEPHLAGADIAALSDDRIAALARQTRIDRPQLDLLAHAVRLGRQLDRLAGADAAAPRAMELAEAEILYGLLREGALANPDARSATQIEAGARRAIEAGVVSAGADEAAKERLTQLKRVAVLLPSASSRGSLGDVLATLPRGEQLGEDEQVRFAALHTAFGDREALWEAVEASDLGARVAPLKRTVALQQLTGAYTPIMRALQTRTDAASDSSGAFLAAVRPTEWRELALTHGAPEGESPLAYAERLQTAVERRFPTAALRARLENGDVEIKRFPIEGVKTFLARNPDFDFKAPDFEAQLESRSVQDDNLRGALAAFRRTLGAAGGRIDAAAALIDAGLDSSFAITNLGPQRFRGRMREALPERVIEDIQAVADNQVLSGVALNTAVWARSRTSGHRETSPEVPGGPTLRSLFGSMDFCECSHCRSVLGPAAYLADLLHFLETSAANGDGTATVLESLAARRPDLRHLDLSCENTNTEIPYTDLVLEILENAVALPVRIAGAGLPGAAPAAVVSNLTAGRIPFVNLPVEIKGALGKTAIVIGETVSVDLLNRSDGTTRILDWAISDGSRRWELVLRPEQLNAWRELPGGAQVISIGGFNDLAGVVASLTIQNQLHPELITRLAPRAAMPLQSSSVATNVQTPGGAMGWRATLTREMVLEFPAVGDGRVKFMDAGNQVLYETDVIDYLNLYYAQQALNAKLANPAADIDANVFWAGAIAKLHLPVSINLLKVSIPPAPAAGAGSPLIGPRYAITATETYLLEVTSGELTVAALAYQNSSILSHQEAQPENRNPEAYRRLAAAHFPWSLPFDLPLEETRAFLEKLGTPRRTLIEMALPEGPMTDRRAAEILGLSTAEWSIIAPPPGGSGLPPIWQLWGVDQTSNEIWDERAGFERTGSWLEVLSWVSMVMHQARLSHRELLDVLQTLFLAVDRPKITPEGECEPSKLKLTAADLGASLRLIHRFVRLWRKTGWTIRELDRALVVFNRTLDEAALRGIALMHLLHERLRIPIVRLAATLGSIEIAAWTKNTAEGAPIESSLYDRLFQPSALRSSPSFARFKLDSSGRLPTPTFDANGNPALADTVVAHAAFIASAIGVSPQDVVDLSGPKDVISFGTLSSLLGAATFTRALKLTVKDYLRWSAVLGDQTPFAAQGAARAEALLLFADHVAFARRIGKSLEELEYLLLHKSTGAFLDADARVAAAAKDVRSALRSGEVLGVVSASNLSTQLLRAGVPAPFAAAVTSEASLVGFLWAEIKIAISPTFKQPDFPAATLGRFYCEIDAAHTTARFGCRGFVSEQSFDALEQAPASSVGISAADRQSLRRRYGLIRSILASQLQNKRTPRFEAAVAQPGPPLTLPADVRGFLSYESSKGLTLIGLVTSAQTAQLKAVLPAALGSAVDNLVSQCNAFTDRADPAVALAALEAPHAFGTDREASTLERALCLVAPWLELDLLSAQAAALSGLTQALCRELLGLIKVSGGATAATAFFAPAFLLTEPAAPSSYAEQAEAVTRLRKTALLLAGSPLQKEQLHWLFGATFTVVAVNLLPATAGAARGSFTAWRAYRELLQAAQSTPDGLAVLASLGVAIAASDAGQRNGILAAAFELPDQQHVAEACAADMLNLGWAELKQPGRLLQLFALLNLSRILGCAPSDLKRLAAPAPGEGDALLARKLFMSQFDSETLPARMEQVSNVLRARQRDALIDYLRSHERLRQADDLLDYYLIDVQMSTCMRTSRIRQAISSVQLFVQRSLLGLERRVAHPVWPEHIDGGRWKWMQNYRVWEANRKVFLFAENWIEPDLRDDKTEIFRAFESELLQEDLTHERAVGAFRSYVQGLAEVARPVIVSTWHEIDASGRRRMHVAARDRGTPHKFYYRSAVLTSGLGVRWSADWSPWERIDAEFPSGHIMVCEMDGIVYLLSPAINRDDQDGWKIHMEALRRTEAGWVSLKKSLDSFTHVLVPNKSIAQSFVFRPFQVTSTFGKTVQVLCFRAIVKENERITLRNQGNVSVNSASPYLPYLPQDAHPISIRIVDHFKDPANQNSDTYQLSDIGFTLRAQFEVRWFYRDVFGAEKELSPTIDQAAYDRAFTFNDGVRRVPTNTSAAVSKPSNFTENVRLSDLMDNSFNATIKALSEQERTPLAKVLELKPDASWMTTEQKIAVGIAIAGAVLSGGAAAPAVVHLIATFAAVHLANTKAPIYYRVGRISGIDIQASVPEADKTKFSNTTFVQRIPLETYNNYGTISLDFVLDYKDGEVPRRAGADRQLEFERAGAFEFDESRALIYLTPSQSLQFNLVKDPPLEGCEYFDSGYLRRAPRTPPPPGQHAPLRVISPSQVVLSDSTNGFFVVKANGPFGWDSMRPIGAYSDSRFVLFFIAGGDGKYRVLPNGGMWVWAGLRELGDRTWDAAELDRMPAPVSGPAAAKIPFHPGCPILDFESSPATVDLAFDRDLPASIYDWEAFFHAPLLIATQLSQGQRFAEARQWFHTIFDPTSDRPAPANLPLDQQEAVRYWRFPPFREAALKEMEVDDLLEAYAKGTLPASDRARLDANIRAWKDNPFNPHLVARFRVRSYMWAVIIKYAQNHLAWADQLYRRDTIESINEATQLYVLVARMLGPRPQSAPRRSTAAHSYAYLAGPLMDELSNVWREWETFAPAQPPSAEWIPRDPTPVEMLPLPIPIGAIPMTIGAVPMTIGAVPMTIGANPMTIGTIVMTPPPAPPPSESAVAGLRSIASLYFCIPGNADLETLWDTVEDRLFKIRHCMNIDGVERRLPLFEPPIDPGLLVRAVAAGLDIADVLAGLGAPLPLHRFSVMLTKAMEVCADLRALGAAALSALEKRDAEEIVLLRNDHEIALLKLTEQVRQQQISEADIALQGLVESRRTAEERLKHYQRLLDRRDVEIPEQGETVSLAPIVTPLAKSGLDGKEQGLGISQTELDQINRLEEARAASLRSGVANTIGGVLLTIGGILSAAPRGSNPGPILGNLGGGLTGAGHGFNAAASAYQALAGYLNATAGMDAIVGGYERRRDDWIFQSNMALREIAQIDKQSAAAQLRKEIAEKELTNLRTQIENAKSVQDFLKSKYSSAQLYRYMSNHLVTLHYRSHQLALEVARRAERCFQFELGQPKTSFVKATYWDTTRKGLLSGEQLHFDLRRMDTAYLENHKRDYELTRHVSLLQIDPVALIALRQTGRCEFSIPELLYDLDCPGHYMRRIKTVNVTIPCITGPYTGVHCKLTLLSSSVRRDPTGQDYARKPDDPRFVDDYSAIQSIVTSGAQGDAGLFEPNLRDERYLPFEGAGAVSTWRLEMPIEHKQFDYATISDVILHLRYTAREGGEPLRQAAVGSLAAVFAPTAGSGLARLFSLRHEFPTEWARLTQASTAARSATFAISASRFPFFVQGRRVKIKQVDLFGVPAKDEDVPKTLPALAQPSAASVVISATTTKADPKLTSVSLSDLNKLQVGMTVTGTNIGVGAVISGINPGTGTVTLSVDSTGSGDNVAATCMPSVPTKLGSPIGNLVHNIAEDLDVEVENDETKSLWTLSAVSDLAKLRDILLVCSYTAT